MGELRDMNPDATKRPSRSRGEWVYGLIDRGGKVTR